jgi:hypothetical protein
MTTNSLAFPARDRSRAPDAIASHRRLQVNGQLRVPVASLAGSCKKRPDGPVQLQLQLWTDEPPHKARQVAPGDDPANAADAGRVLWTDDAVRRLHVAVLHHALGVLKSKARGNAAEKCEVLRWIWAPAVFCWVTRIRDGVATRVPIYRRQLPFTFETCCAFDGQHPEVLRDLLEDILRPLLKELALESPIT